MVREREMEENKHLLSVHDKSQLWSDYFILIQYFVNLRQGGIW